MTRPGAPLLTYPPRASASLPLNPPPLPANTVDYWISEAQCNLTNWIGQKNGTVIDHKAYPALPGAVRADGTYFNGRPVAISTQSGNQGAHWFNSTDFLPPLLPVGSKPFQYWVGRMIGPPNGQGGYSAFSCMPDDGWVRMAYGSGGYEIAGFYSGRWVIGPFDNQQPKRIWFLEDGTQMRMKVGAVEYTATVAPTTHSVNRVTIGAFSVGSYPMNGAHGFYLLSNGIPSAPELTALDTWAAGYYAVSV